MIGKHSYFHGRATILRRKSSEHRLHNGKQSDDDEEKGRLEPKIDHPPICKASVVSSPSTEHERAQNARRNHVRQKVTFSEGGANFQDITSPTSPSSHKQSLTPLPLECGIDLENTSWSWDFFEKFTADSNVAPTYETGHPTPVSQRRAALMNLSLGTINTPHTTPHRQSGRLQKGDNRTTSKPLTFLPALQGNESESITDSIEKGLVNMSIATFALGSPRTTPLVTPTPFPGKGGNRFILDESVTNDLVAMDVPLSPMRTPHVVGREWQKEEPTSWCVPVLQDNTAVSHEAFYVSQKGHNAVKALECKIKELQSALESMREQARQERHRREVAESKLQALEDWLRQDCL
ncbi:hypothetical protein ACA910_016835 [Epithemia clementina (nom. ined.)]